MLLGVALFIATTTTAFFTPSTALAAYMPPAETLQERGTRIALDHHISTSTLFNLVDSESTWDPNASGDHGCSWGLTQQNICAHPGITKEQALDPEWALNKAATDIEKGMDYIYSSCNCYSLVSTKIKNLPHMADIQTNTTVPHKGQVAIFYYREKGTGKIIKHIAYVTNVSGGDITIQEANKIHCLVDTRVIHLSDTNLVGFWDQAGV